MVIDTSEATPDSRVSKAGTLNRIARFFAIVLAEPSADQLTANFLVGKMWKT